MSLLISIAFMHIFRFVDAKLALVRVVSRYVSHVQAFANRRASKKKERRRPSITRPRRISPTARDNVTLCREAVQPAFERHQISFQTASVYLRSSTTPLEWSFETYCLGGQTLRVEVRSPSKKKWGKEETPPLSRAEA